MNVWQLSIFTPVSCILTAAMNVKAQFQKMSKKTRQEYSVLAEVNTEDEWNQVIAREVRTIFKVKIKSS